MSLQDLSNPLVCAKIGPIPSLSIDSTTVDGDGGFTIRNTNSYFTKTTLASSTEGGLTQNTEEKFIYAPELPDTQVSQIRINPSPSITDSSFKCNWAGPVNPARTGTITGLAAPGNLPVVPVPGASASSFIILSQVAGSAVPSPTYTIDGSGNITFTIVEDNQGNTNQWKYLVVG